VLLVLVRVEFDNVWDLAVGERLETLSCVWVGTSDTKNAGTRETMGRQDFFSGTKKQKDHVRFRSSPLLTSLSIPQLDLPIVTRAEESRAIVVERDILDRFRVTKECPQAVALVVDVP
jgi:hypothetical protein